MAVAALRPRGRPWSYRPEVSAAFARLVIEYGLSRKRAAAVLGFSPSAERRWRLAIPEHRALLERLEAERRREADAEGLRLRVLIAQ